jgi:hypothetical protein
MLTEQFSRNEQMPHDNPAVASLKIEQRAQRAAARDRGADGELHDALKRTFPASDPVSMQTSFTPGSADEHSDHELYEMAGERVSRLEEILANEIRARPLRAIGWAAVAGLLVGFWAAR